jgi:RNA polymerase sigma factor (TIGR02999 family)
MSAVPEVTELLTELRDGRKEAVDRLLPVVYEELRRVARRQLGHGRTRETVGTTALVHEAYIKLVDQTRVGWHDRAHFFAVAAMAMRQILIDQARRRGALKRGGAQRRIMLDETMITVDDQAESLLALDQALSRLATFDDRLARVVECRFFGGLTEEETAVVLGVTARTVRRDWVKAKGLLYHELGQSAPTS